MKSLFGFVTSNGSYGGSVAGYFSNTPNPDPSATDPGTTAGELIAVVLVTAILVFCIIFLIRFLKNRMRPRGGRGLEVITIQPLSGTRSIAVVKLQDQVYVLGVGNDVQLIDKIEDPELVSKLAAFEDHQLLPFDHLLKKKLEQLSSQRNQLESWDREE